MKTSPLAAFALTLLASSLPLTRPAQAETGIQHCEAADGTMVYTDKACLALGAASRPLPSELLNRIAREEARTGATSPTSAAIATSSHAVVARRSPAAGCARSPTQLSMDLQGSIALRDVNRLAESYHWVGMTHAQSKPIMQKLERLAPEPLEAVHFFDAQIGSGGMQFADAGTSNAVAGIMQLRFGGELRQVLEFEVQRYAGCYFIQF